MHRLLTIGFWLPVAGYWPLLVSKSLGGHVGQCEGIYLLVIWQRLSSNGTIWSRAKRIHTTIGGSVLVTALSPTSLTNDDHFN